VRVVIVPAGEAVVVVGADSGPRGSQIGGGTNPSAGGADSGPKPRV
jgi:hypothetical protein